MNSPRSLTFDITTYEGLFQIRYSQERSISLLLFLFNQIYCWNRATVQMLFEFLTHHVWVEYDNLSLLAKTTVRSFLIRQLLFLLCLFSFLLFRHFWLFTLIDDLCLKVLCRGSIRSKRTYSLVSFRTKIFESLIVLWWGRQIWFQLPKPVIRLLFMHILVLDRRCLRLLLQSCRFFNLLSIYKIILSGILRRALYLNQSLFVYLDLLIVFFKLERP